MSLRENLLEKVFCVCKANFVYESVHFRLLIQLPSLCVSFSLPIFTCSLSLSLSFFLSLLIHLLLLLPPLLVVVVEHPPADSAWIGAQVNELPFLQPVICLPD